MPQLLQLPNHSWQIHAHAKLNLGLRVFPPRPDGFHDLETWMVPISWYDTLTLQATPNPLTLRITGRSAGIPAELDKNLVGRAASALANAAGIPATGILSLHKVLPPGGGIGGGSSDAAAALVALNTAWNLHLPTESLETLAATLGSDIPFFIRARPTLCTGRGEIMTPLPLSRPLFAVLIIPPQGCPTREVYQTFDRLLASRAPAQVDQTDWQRCANAGAEELSALLINDLQPAAFTVAPWLADLQKQAAAAIRRTVHLTGSGSTLFTLCDSARQAADLHAQLSAALPCPSVPVEILR